MLLFSISGCQKKRTAKEVLESSLKQSSKLKDADFSGEASYKIANSEASSSSNVTIKMNFDTKLQTVDKDRVKNVYDFYLKHAWADYGYEYVLF